MEKNSDERDGTMSAKVASFEIGVECTGRRDRGKK
jgi:hypothetical protein